MAFKPLITSDIYRFGEEFELDLRAYELRSGGTPLKLKPIPTELLIFLVERRGELVTREEIVERIWGKGVFLDTDNSINGAISKIRQVLRDDAVQPCFVQTVTGKGYRFIAPVMEASLSAEAVVQAPQLMADSLIGRRITHYRILELLGGGGMGVVYRAEDLKLGRRVAIKFLPAELATSPQAFERLEREARAASALDHRNICSVYELDEHEGQPFIVMQLLEGKTLQELIEAAADREGLPLTEVLDIAIQVADGLQAAHQKGIIHRDIKPANIFTTSRNEVKILDFGLAKIVEGDPDVETDRQNEQVGGEDRGKWPKLVPNLRLTLTGINMGTAFYMSPEQIRGERLDQRTDLFSFGLVLYQMVTGHRAFPGHTTGVVHDGILHQEPPPVRQVKSALPPELERIITHAIEKDRELRYQAAAEMRRDFERLQRTLTGHPAPHAVQADRASAKYWRIAVAAFGMLAAVTALIAFHNRSAQASKLTNKDTVVLADFVNTTGEPVFDSTLRQGLSAQLEQSPFLNLLSDGQIRRTLALMTQPQDTPLTHQLATEVCQRTASAATIEGSIANLGNQYVLSLKAVNCRNSDLLAEEQVTANSKERVLPVLGDAAAQLRQKLGESVGSIQAYDVPPAQVTTSSLEAMNDYSLGSRAFREKGEAEAIPFFRQAIQLDPNFAMAYLALGMNLTNRYQFKQGIPYLKKALELSDHVSASERFNITSLYALEVDGDLLKANDVYRVWARTYPQDPTPWDDLGNSYLYLGDYPEALETLLQEKRLAPATYNYHNLLPAYIALGRYSEAREVIRDVSTRKNGRPDYKSLYLIDFAEGKTDAITADAAWGVDKGAVANSFYTLQSDTAAYTGHRKQAWDLSLRAAASAQSNHELEVAALRMGEAALHEAEFGKPKQVASALNSAFALTQSRDVKTFAALAYARAGLVSQARTLANELAAENPSHTMLHVYWLPTIEASIYIHLNQPDKAVEALEIAHTYELGEPDPMGPGTLYPAYVRGEAYLRLKEGDKAAAEFQKLLEHRGCVLNYPLGALAHLELGRAYALSGNKDKARAAYQDFLTLWKDADPDIPILQQAKTEYSSLN